MADLTPSNWATVPIQSEPKGISPKKKNVYIPITLPRILSSTWVWTRALLRFIIRICPIPARNRKMTDAVKLLVEAKRIIKIGYKNVPMVRSFPLKWNMPKEAMKRAEQSAPSPRAVCRNPLVRASPCRIFTAQAGKSVTNVAPKRAIIPIVNMRYRIAGWLIVYLIPSFKSIIGELSVFGL